MKKKVIEIVLIIVVMLGSLACLQWPRMVPLEECSEVYRRYEGLDGIEVAYIQDFPVNDTLTMGVTLLEATTDTGWECLTKEIHMSDDMLTVLERFGMLMWMMPQDNPKTRVEADGVGSDANHYDDNLEICACSYQKKNICIFHTHSRQEIMAVEQYNYNIMIEKRENKQIQTKK